MIFIQNFNHIIFSIKKSLIGTLSNQKVIGMIGPLDYHKGHNFILEVIKKLDINKYIFVIVGKGIMFNSIKSKFIR